MRIGLLSSSPVVLGAMSFLYETGNLAGVAVPSTKVDFIDQLETYSSQYQFKFTTIDIGNLEASLLDWLHEIEPDVVFDGRCWCLRVDGKRINQNVIYGVFRSGCLGHIDEVLARQIGVVCSLRQY